MAHPEHNAPLPTLVCSWCIANGWLVQISRGQYCSIWCHDSISLMGRRPAPAGDGLCRKGIIISVAAQIWMSGEPLWLLRHYPGEKRRCLNLFLGTEHMHSSSDVYRSSRAVAAACACLGLSSYKRVKGRSHTVEKQINIHPHKLHAPSPPSRVSHTPRLSTDTAHNQPAIDGVAVIHVCMYLCMIT